MIRISDNKASLWWKIQRVARCSRASRPPRAQMSPKHQTTSIPKSNKWKNSSPCSPKTKLMDQKNSSRSPRALKLPSNLLIKTNNKPKLSLRRLCHHRKTPRRPAVIIRSLIRPPSRRISLRSQPSQASKMVKIIITWMHRSIFALRIQAIILTIAFIRIMSATAKNNLTS